MSVHNPYDDSVIKGAGWTNETLKAIKEYVDALETGLGAFTAAENLKAILGAYTAAAPLKAAIDAILEDTATTLEGKLDALALICTAARGLLIDRLSLIAAGGAGELTAARAALLSNLDAAISSRAPSATALSTADWPAALATALSAYTAAKAAFLDVAISSRAPGATALTNATWTDLLAAYIWTIPITAMRGTDNAMLAVSGARILCSMDFWSVPVEEVAVPAAEATLNTLPSVVVADLPGGAVIVRAIAMFKARMIENINVAANSLDGATDPGVRQVIQVKDSAAGAQTDAIKFVDEQFSIGAGPLREGGDVLIGSIDISGAGIVDANDTYAFRWLLAKAHLLGINFNDVQTGLRIWYSV